MSRTHERDDDRYLAVPAELSQRLDTTYNLALFGAEALGREMCASVFLNHAFELVRYPEAKQRFVECLLLLGMASLLSRLLRATDGVEVIASTAARHGCESLVLDLSNGHTVAQVLPGPGAGRDERATFASSLSRAVLDAAARAPAPGSSHQPAIDPVRAGLFRRVRPATMEVAG